MKGSISLQAVFMMSFENIITSVFTTNQVNAETIPFSTKSVALAEPLPSSGPKALSTK